MQQIVLIYLFLGLLVGLPALFLIAITWHLHRTKVLFYYLVIFFCMTIQLLTNLTVFYLSIVSGTGLSTASMICILVSTPFSIIMYFLMPLFFHDLLRLPYEKKAQPIIFVLGLCTMILSLSPLCSEYDFNQHQIHLHAGNTVINILFALMSLYVLALPIVRWRKIEDKSVKRKLIQFLVLAVLFLPGIIRDSFYFSNVQEVQTVPSIILFFPFFYMFWAVGTLYYTIRHIVKALREQPNRPLGQPELQQFFQLHELTAREKEIVVLLASGIGNKAIADKLGISSRTVGNHIYNTYQKLHVSTRFELLALIQKELTVG